MAFDDDDNFFGLNLNTQMLAEIIRQRMELYKKIKDDSKHWEWEDVFAELTLEDIREIYYFSSQIH